MSCEAYAIKHIATGKQFVTTNRKAAWETRAKISREEIVKLIDEKHESTCEYFANLVAIGYAELMKSNIGVTV